MRGVVSDREDTPSRDHHTQPPTMQETDVYVLNVCVYMHCACMELFLLLHLK